MVSGKKHNHGEAAVRGAKAGNRCFVRLRHRCGSQGQVKHTVKRPIQLGLQRLQLARPYRAAHPRVAQRRHGGRSEARVFRPDGQELDVIEAAQAGGDPERRRSGCWLMVSTTSAAV